MAQQAGTFAMDLGDRAAEFTLLIRNRGSAFTGMFNAVFTSEGIRLHTPVQAIRSPNDGSPQSAANC